MTTADRLRRIAEAAPALGPDGEWLASALRRYLALAPTGGTMDAALGLARDPGHEPWWRTEAQQRRDDLIREIARLFFAGRARKATAEGIIQAARRYETTGWTRVSLTAPIMVAEIVIALVSNKGEAHA